MSSSLKNRDDGVVVALDDVDQLYRFITCEDIVTLDYEVGNRRANYKTDSARNIGFLVVTKMLLDLVCLFGHDGSPFKRKRERAC
jgi:hypothetical protein